MNWKPHVQRLLPLTTLAALSLITLPTILTPGQLACSAVDARLFLIRLSELDRLIDRGVFWPRWAPNLAYGYGYPIFHFYGSLSLYPSLLLHRLGLSHVAALQAGFWLALVLSGWAVYAWLRSVTRDERAALAGATAYLFVPYHLNTAFHRLNLAEPWAMVFAPLALYGLHRMSQRSDWRAVGITALAASALLLTSNLAAIVFAPLLVAYVLLLLFLSSQRSILLRRQIASAGLAAGLAAFFLIPAFVDRRLIKVEHGFTASGLNVFHNSLTLRQIFQSLLTTDISRANPPRPNSLGPIVIAAALIGLTILWKRLDGNRRGHVVWSAVVGTACVFMSTPASTSFYRALPFLNVLQFPWRFLAPATLPVALLVGVAVCRLLRTTSGTFAPVILWSIILGLVLLGWPWLYPGLLCDVSPTFTLRNTLAYQTKTGMPGTVAAEYIPVTVEEMPTTSPMAKDYKRGQSLIRWDQSRLPAAARTVAIQDSDLSATWEIDTPFAFEAVYRAFMFPGWRATVDGQPVDIQIAPPYGLIQIAVPAGHHTLAVRFGSTLDRTLATAVSIAALFITAGSMLAKDNTAVARPWCGARLGARAWIAVGAMGVALLAARVGLVDRFNWLPRVKRFDGQTVQGIAHPTSVAYSGGHRLLGYELLTQPGSSGGPLEVELYWATATGANFRGVIRLTDEQGTAWTEWNKTVVFAGFAEPPPVYTWGSDLYAVKRYHVEVPPGMPPGEFNLSVETFDPDTLSKYSVTHGTPLNAERTEAILGQLTIRRQLVKAARLAELAGADGGISVGNGLTLLRYDATREHASVGEPVVLSLLWHAETPSTVETLGLHLRDTAGDVIYSETRPFSPRYPPHQWQPGELVRDQLQVLIPASLPPGSYDWTAEVAGHEVPLGTLTVSVPERGFHLLPDVQSVGQTLDNFAELAGYRADPLVAGQPFTIRLYWRAREGTNTHYKAFVHLLSPQDTVVAQSDGIPAAWTRLTTSWLPPEVIEDVHTLFPPGDLSPGVYRVVVGLYEPATGRRATTPGGQDSIVLTELSPTLP